MTMPSRTWSLLLPRVLARSLCALALASCAPSDFDDLTSRERSESPAQCDAASHPECGSAASDASRPPSVPDDAGDRSTPDASGSSPADASAPLDARAPDAATPPEAGAPAEAGAAPGPDAAMPPPAPCGGRAPVCRADEAGRESEACGNCGSGTRSRTRSCAADGCSWGAWGSWSECSGQSGCKPGDTSACAPADSCGNRVCTARCTWSDCQPKAGAACLRRRTWFDNGKPVTQEEGSNYRCCSRSGGGGWQFCQPNCQWSSSCAACMPQFCECN